MCSARFVCITMKVNSSIFQTIQSQFLCGWPIKKIEWKDILEKITWDEQKQFIEETIRLPEVQKYPIQSKYVVRFLRHIIDTLEKHNLDVHDDFYIIFCEYQAQADDTTNYSYKHYRIRTEGASPAHNVILKENINKISQGTTGLNVWESALVLSEWTITNESYLRNKCIMELGAGTGLTSLLIGKCCEAKSIIASDGNDKVIEILEENFSNNFDRRNNSKFSNGKNGTNFDVVKLDWSLDNGELISKCFKEVDIIIAADIVYDNTLFRPLLRTVCALFEKCTNCKQFLLVNAVRNSTTEQEFLDMLGDFGLNYSDMSIAKPKYLHWEQSDFLPIKLYSITSSETARPSNQKL